MVVAIAQSKGTESSVFMRIPVTSDQKPPSHSQEYLCEWAQCGASFGSGEDLYKHICATHIERRQCKVSNPRHGTNRQSSASDKFSLFCQWGSCKVSVLKRDHMTSHVRIHVNMKPFQCSECEKKFKRPQDLKKHMKTHNVTARKPVASVSRDISSSAPSSPAEQSIVKASLELLTDVHTAQIKPEFSESLAQRLNTIAPILDNSDALHTMVKTFEEKVENPVAFLDEVDDFLEKVSVDISERQISMLDRIEHHNTDGFSLGSEVKPIFPSLPFEAGTEADLVRGPRYFSPATPLPPRNNPVIQQEAPHAYQPWPLDFTNNFGEHQYQDGSQDHLSQPEPQIPPQQLYANDRSLQEPQRQQQQLPQVQQLPHQMPHNYVSYDEADLTFQKLFHDLPGFWEPQNSMGVPHPSTGLPAAPVAPVPTPTPALSEPQWSGLDKYLSYYRKRSEVQHTLEVTSGLRCLIQDVRDPFTQ